MTSVISHLLKRTVARKNVWRTAAYFTAPNVPRGNFCSWFPPALWSLCSASHQLRLKLTSLFFSPWLHRKNTGSESYIYIYIHTHIFLSRLSNPCPWMMTHWTYSDVILCNIIYTIISSLLLLTFWSKRSVCFSAKEQANAAGGSCSGPQLLQGKRRNLLSGQSDWQHVSLNQINSIYIMFFLVIF